jgi:DNA-binding MarR family transcriptional regulator
MNIPKVDRDSSFKEYIDIDLIKRAKSLLIDDIESAVVGSDLTFTQWVVLMHLRDELALNGATLCSQLRHNSGTLTRIIDQLELRGLVQRERSHEDRRVVRLKVTDAGQITVAALIPRVVDRLNFALRDFTSTEFEELIRLLTKMNCNLDGVVGKLGVAI